MHRWLPLVFLLLSGLARSETTVAVIPLSLGAGSEEFAGLGDALAGMIVADLSVVDGLQLVERSKLGALLSEIALSDTGFVDPATAQTLGRGVGAEVVLVGTYSVVGETFALDARLVGVASGGVVKAAAAHGTVGDFVTVQKEVVEGLVEGLDVAITAAVRRKLLGRVSTESFPAVASYGRGLHLEGAGDLDGAAGAFEEALGADPAFEEATAALRAVRGALAAAVAGEATFQQAKAERGAAWVLATYPDERDRKARFVDTDEDLVGFALRMTVLYDTERHCDRYAELWHFWERRGDPAIGEPLVSWGGRFFELAKANDVKVGLWPRYFKSRAEFVLDSCGGLYWTVRQCFTDPVARLAETERILARVDRVGMYDDAPHEVPWSTVGRELELAVLKQLVRLGRVDDAFRARVEGLLARHPEGAPYRDALLRDVERVVADAEKGASP